MHVLVTGGAGFIGSNLADRLILDGHAVRILDDFSTGYWENLNPTVEVIEADVTDLPAVRKAVEGVEVVFHQAAHRAVQRSVEHPLATDTANTHGTLTVLEAAREAGVRRVVCASSSSVYGGTTTLPTPESTPALPRSPYAVSKLGGEHYCRIFTELYGLETVSLRYFNVYGPRQRPDSAYAAVIPLFLHAIRSGEAAVVHGDGRQSRDFTFIDDVVSANVAAAGASAFACNGKVYNIAAGAAHSLIELLEILGKILGIRPRWTHTDRRPGDVRHTQANIAAAREDLGYEPRVGFEEGLGATVAWFAGR
ncbi:MAG: SDR family oxidoreductase [Actinomycetota bacterium]